MPNPVPKDANIDAATGQRCMAPPYGVSIPTSARSYLLRELREAVLFFGVTAAACSLLLR